MFEVKIICHYLEKLPQIFFDTWTYRSSTSKVFFEKGALNVCSKFTGEHPHRSAISIKLEGCF